MNWRCYNDSSGSHVFTRIGTCNTQLGGYNKRNIRLCENRKEPLICELILERYIYLRNTQKQQKITNYVRNKSFLEFHLVSNGVCLKLLGSIL